MTSRRALFLLLAGVLIISTALRVHRATQVSGLSYDTPVYHLPAIDHFGDFVRGAYEIKPRGLPWAREVGFPALVRAARDATGLSTRDALQAVTFAGDLALLLLVTLLGCRVADPAAGLGAAALLATHPFFIDQAVVANTEAPFLALAVGSLVVALGGAPLTPGRAAAAGLLAGASAYVRAPGIALVPAVGLIGFARWRRGEASRLALAALVATAVVIGGLAVASPILAGRTVALDVEARQHLFDMGRFPDAQFTDASGRVLRVVSPDVSVPIAPALAAMILRWVRCLATTLGPLGAFCLVAILRRQGRARNDALLAVAFALAPVAATVAALALPIERYVAVAIPVLSVFAAEGALGLASRKRSGRTAVAAVAVGLATGWLLGAISSGTRDPAVPGFRARADECGRELARHLPPGTVVAHGPGADPRAIGLAGSYVVYMPSGPTPEAVSGYFRAHRLGWIAYALDDEPLVRGLLPGWTLATECRFRFGPRALAVARLTPP